MKYRAVIARFTVFADQAGVTAKLRDQISRALAVSQC